MQVPDDLRRSVVFLGFSAPEKGGIDCIGTGFLVLYEETGYLATAKHIAINLGDFPFLVRLNKPDGTSDNILFDHVEWHFHPDSNVDIAVMLLHVADNMGYDRFYLHGEMLTSLDEEHRIGGSHIGIGDPVYTVGLFRLLAGNQRNLPVLHTGSISLMPGQELIPIRDWEDPNHRLTRFVDGYLVEAMSLSGLSGSPVFIRPTLKYQISGVHAIIGESNRLYLLGLWQGAWDAPPGEVLGAEHGSETRVPVGMGIVVPTARLIEILNTRMLQEQREMRRAAGHASPEN